MASVPPEKRRKKYLHKDAVFDIPSSTKHRWEQRESTDKTNTSPFVNGSSCSSSVDRRACANEAAGSADSVPCVGEASCSTATTDFFEVTDIGHGIGADSGCVRYRGTLPDEERTPQGVRRDMEVATLTGRPVNGVKGPSPLARLPHFDLVWGFSVDYMHSVFLGVTRQFTDYLFNSTNCREDFYLGSPSIVATVNQRLLSIKPPHTMTRLPRPVGDRCFWKASEWRLWLLFYVLPCTLGILKQRYWKHLRCLVEAIHMLLSEELTPRMLETAGGLLRKFVGRVEPLYKKGACMTFNVHQLLHLPKAAEQLGPLWAHPAFVFEGGNGEIVKSVTSA
ncbi:conserved hypothetical protein [Ixodes scapularis]|uniref:Uncharacterized protein n=1 Tax=Ixodes scapularis TaxID=6945 RepID=B7PHK2_IXOSC|nr:conserved hypothetical protein [Ixodes scapularis]|eukprot:XP_002402993.1 conserved hypothetical protein [Ixodes scapularis]